MKFGNNVLCKAESIKVGDTVVFQMGSADYVVDAVETTDIGMIRHQHRGGSSSYWPNELLYARRNNGGEYE